jgi:hypothetical protein
MNADKNVDKKIKKKINMVSKEVDKSNKKLRKCSQKKCANEYDEILKIKEECKKAKPKKKTTCIKKYMKSAVSVSQCEKKACPVESNEVDAKIKKLVKTIIVNVNDKDKSKK